MSSTTKLVMLFPGQGAYRPGSLQAAAREFPVVEETIHEVDTVCLAHFGRSVRNLLLERTAPSLDTLLARDPDMLQMAIYTASVCAYRILQLRGCQASVLAGHSLGEIAALVCAGAFSVRQGAEILVARSVSLESAAGLGYMAALSAPSRRCASLIDALDAGDVCVAVDNGSQTVVSGSAVSMQVVAAVAQILGISFVKLAAAHPFHSPLLAPMVDALKSAIARHPRGPLQVQVYSPILERAYEQDEDLAAALSSHLVRPVRFAQAIRLLARNAAPADLTFVEAGASTALVKIVKQALNDPQIAAFPTLNGLSGEGDSLHATLAALQAKGLLRAPVDAALLSSLLPQACAEDEVRRFWHASGDRILAHIHEEWRRYRAGPALRAVPPALAPAVSTPAAPVLASASRTAAPAPAQSGASNRGALSREALQQQIIAVFAQAMEYPPEVFTEDVQLEAELGIDSVKQMELLGKLETQFRLPPRPDTFRLSDYGTLRKITDFVYQTTAQFAELVDQDLPACEPIPALIAAGVTVSGSGLPSPTAAASQQTPVALPTRERLKQEIIALFAEALEYPHEVFTEDVALEAELGIDSVKQMELLGKLESRYQLPARPENFRLSDYGTLGKITDFVHQAMSTGNRAPAARASAYAVR